MPVDDDADDDEGQPVPPPLPDDRLWRHPSEVSSFGQARVAAAVPAPVEARAPVWSIALVAGFAGAVLCGGLLALTGRLSSEPERAIERVKVTPILPSPLLTDDETVDALKDRVGPAVVRLELVTQEGDASACGVVVRDDGVVLTSAHDIAQATAVTVVLQDGRSVDGEVVGYDLPTDVGVIRIEAGGLTAAVLGSSTDLEPGRAVVAIGTTHDGELTVSTGVVSALGQRIDVGGTSFHGLIKTDAPIEGAWSGGPLVDDTGAVVGITNDLSGDRTRFGFATPIELVHRLANELLTTGRVAHGWLGIEASDLAKQEAEELGIDEGAEVRRVMAGSPAADAGLVVGDVITEVAGTPVGSSSELVVLLRLHKPDDLVEIGYWRGSRHSEITVMVEPHPDR